MTIASYKYSPSLVACVARRPYATFSHALSGCMVSRAYEINIAANKITQNVNKGGILIKKTGLKVNRTGSLFKRCQKKN